MTWVDSDEPLRRHSPPERTADLPNDLFPRESHVLQHPIVEQVQPLPALAASQPPFDSPDPAKHGKLAFREACRLGATQLQIQ